MSNINITSAGIDAKLKNLVAEPTARPRTAAAQTPARPQLELIGDPKHVSDLPVPDKPTAEELSLLSEDALRSLVSEMHQALSTANKPPLNVDFRPDERNKGFVIEIRTESGDLVRQFPPELILNLRRKLDELSGMVIDQVV